MIKSYGGSRILNRFRPSHFLVLGLLSVSLVLGLLTVANADDLSDWDSYQNIGVESGTFPYHSTGIVISDGPTGTYRCTATLIHNRMVATAAHCIHSGTGNDSNNFYQNIEFCPDYPSLGKCWESETASVPSEWAANGAREEPDGTRTILHSNDFGFIRLAPDAAGEVPVDYVEWLNVNFGGPRDEVLRAHGYPAQDPYPGDSLYILNADFAGESSPLPGDPYTLSGGDWCQPGASGTPLIQNFTYTRQLRGQFNRPTHVLSGSTETECFWSHLSDRARSTFFIIYES